MKRKCPEKSSVMNGLPPSEPARPFITLDVPDERTDEAATGGDGRTQFAANPVVGVVPVEMAEHAVKSDPRPADGVEAPEAPASGSGGGAGDADTQAEIYHFDRDAGVMTS